MASIKLSDFGKGYNEAIKAVIALIWLHKKLPNIKIEHLEKDIKKLWIKK